MTNTDASSSSSSGNPPSQPSTSLDPSQPSAFNALLLGAKQIPLLKAYSGSLWTGIITSDWIKLLEELFIAENITTDAAKINTGWRHIHTSEGSARSILSHNIDIRNATTWQTFKETILSLLTPSTEANAFLAFSKFSKHSWDQ